MTVELAYTVIGDPDKPMLVMSSALGTTRAMWDAQHPLAANHALLLYDHRGLGASPSPPGPYSVDEMGADVIALIDKLGARTVSFCGVSLGGMVGLWIAANHPDRITSLVVMATLPRLQPAATYTERAAAVRARGIGSIADGVVARWFTEQFAREHPATLRACVETLTAMDAEGYAGCCEALAACDLRTAIHKVDAPTLIIAGAEDPVVPAASAAMFGASFRDANVALVPDAAHLMNIEQPDIVNRLVLDHLSTRNGV
ncbi:MAG: alpha/beta fold hydrolase [Candidatus Dormibacteria bacterium]